MRGLLSLDDAPVFDVPFWNEVMELGPAAWAALRARLIQLLAEGSAERAAVEPLLVPLADAEMHCPSSWRNTPISTPAGIMPPMSARCSAGAENALPPNWLHIPIGYNGRASSVVVSGTPVRRPWGQLKGPDDAAAAFRALRALRSGAGDGRHRRHGQRWAPSRWTRPMR